jgi:hypothetical protein
MRALVVSVSVVVVAETSTDSVVVVVVASVAVSVVSVDTAAGSTSQVPYAVAMTRAPPTNVTLTFHEDHCDFNQSIVLLLFD